MTPRRVINIPVTVGEDYQTGLLRRLKEYGLTQHEVAVEAGVTDSQFSRWVARPSDSTGEPTNIRINYVIQIEAAIVRIRARKRKAERRRKERE